MHGSLIGDFGTIEIEDLQMEEPMKRRKCFVVDIDPAQIQKSQTLGLAKKRHVRRGGDPMVQINPYDSPCKSLSEDGTLERRAQILLLGLGRI